MKIKKILFGNSQQLFLMVSLVASAALLTIGGMSYRSIESGLRTLESLRNGLSICTTRVGQSHYGLLSGADSAKALTSNYLSSTDECFFQFDRKIDELGLGRFEAYSNDIYDEFINYKNMAKNFNIGNVPLSRITSSYNRIDQLRFDIGMAFSKEISESKSSQASYRYMIVFAILLLGMSIAFYFIAWTRRQKNLDAIERDAFSVDSNYAKNSTEVERLIERAFEQLKLPAVKNLFLEYNTYMLERAHPNQIAIDYQESVTVQKEDVRESKNNIEIDEKYINSIFDEASPDIEEASEPEVFEITAADLELGEDDLENQWVSTSSLNNESSINFSLADEFDQMVNETAPVETEEVEIVTQEAQENLELKQISQKVKEALGEFSESSEVAVASTPEPISFESAIEQKIETILASEEVAPAQEDTLDEKMSFQKLLSKITKAYLKREKNADLKWEFASDYLDFDVLYEQETLEQILYSVMSRFEKGFNERKFASSQRTIRVVSVENENGHKQIQFRLKGILFNTAELEYLNHAEQSVRRLIDLNLVTTQELIHGLGGDVNLRNELGEGNIKEGIVNLVIPNKPVEKAASQSGPMLKRIVKGTKAKLLKSLRRETTI